MDNNKIGQKSDGIAFVFEGKVIKTNPFGENRSGDRAYKRAERIVAGLYLVTNHIPHDEPLRNRIRLLSPKLLSSMLEGKDEMRASESVKMREMSSVIRELISLVRMLTVSGLLSQQNSDILVEALDELWQFVSISQKSLLSESVRLTREDLIDVREKTQRVSFIKDIKDNAGVKDRDSVMDTAILPQVSREHETRLENIIEVLRSGGTLGVSDIASNLPQYSEKMIQRALFDLAALGKVKKTGEKRWSRYSIVA